MIVLSEDQFIFNKDPTFVLSKEYDHLKRFK